MRLAEQLLLALKREGAREIFGIPGDFALPLFAAIEQTGILPLYTLSHEPSVGFAASVFQVPHHCKTILPECFRIRDSLFYARLTGLEPATSRVTGGCSNQVELPPHRYDAKRTHSSKKQGLFKRVPGGRIELPT